MILFPRIGTVAAILVILLHSIISHEHFSEMSSERYWTASHNTKSLMDNVVLAFHIDAGSGHLETFTNSDSPGSDFFIPGSIFLPQNNKCSNANNVNYHNPLYKVDRLTYGSRGPPTAC